MSTAEAAPKKSRPKMVLRSKAAPEAEPLLPTLEEHIEATEKSAKKKADPTPSKYKGVTTGMRVVEYQRLSLENNFNNKKTDEQLAEDWCREFPNAIHFTARVVSSARSAFNRGKLGSMTQPDVDLHPYDADGNELPLKTRKSA